MPSDLIDELMLRMLATIAALTERAEQAEAELDLSQTTIYAMNKDHRPDFGPYEDPGYFGDYFRDLTGVGNWGPDEPNEKLRSKVIIGIGMAYTLLEPQRARDVGGLLIERAARAEGKDWAVIQREKLDAEMVSGRLEQAEARVAELEAALRDVQAIQAEYDAKPYLMPVAGWAAIRERLQHADVRAALEANR